MDDLSLEVGKPWDFCIERLLVVIVACAQKRKATSQGKAFGGGIDCNIKSP
jgi:hypothetical protein